MQRWEEKETDLGALGLDVPVQPQHQCFHQLTPRMDLLLSPSFLQLLSSVCSHSPPCWTEKKAGGYGLNIFIYIYIYGSLPAWKKRWNLCLSLSFLCPAWTSLWEHCKFNQRKLQSIPSQLASRLLLLLWWQSITINQASASYIHILIGQWVGELQKSLFEW